MDNVLTLVLTSVISLYERPGGGGGGDSHI